MVFSTFAGPSCQEGSLTNHKALARLGPRIWPERVPLLIITVRLGPRLIPLRLATAMEEHPVVATPVLKPTWATHAEALPDMARPTTRKGAR